MHPKHAFDFTVLYAENDESRRIYHPSMGNKNDFADLRLAEVDYMLAKILFIVICLS